MKPSLRTVLLLACLGVVTVFSAATAQTISELKVDPSLLVSLKECRRIAKYLGAQLYPGWEFEKTPILFYRPNVQELLINFPHRPAGYVDYAGFSPLGEETIYARNDSTRFTVDDQNTSIEIDSIPVLVVADPFSSMRNQLRDVLTQRTKEFAASWLEDWSFIPNPYDKLALILHEAFHVHQTKHAPDKSADEMAVAQYPLLDPVNNALYVLEGSILKDALLAGDRSLRMQRIREFVAVRSYRHSLLDSNSVEYENLNEFVEGTAKYVEYEFLQTGEAIDPGPEMYYQTGFRGYRGVLPEMFKNRLDNMVNIVAVNDDRFGNKYGSGPLRFKLYELGACEALLLDDVMPEWKDQIFNDGVYLSDLLGQSVNLSESELKTLLKQAKAEYGYDAAYKDKQRFEADGRAFVQGKLDAILKTDQTLVQVWYGAVAERLGLAYTPFGVTQIRPRASIYDLVPIQVHFKPGMTLKMKNAVPVFIDRDQKLIAFAVATPGADIRPDAGGELETADFVFSNATMDITREGRIVEIRLK